MADEAMHASQQERKGWNMEFCQYIFCEIMKENLRKPLPCFYRVAGVVGEAVGDSEKHSLLYRVQPLPTLYSKASHV
jgi:hypothetical protein